jgi:putative ABC transport system permease protein
MRATVTGVTPDYSTVYGVKMAEGNFITADDYNSNSRIAVIGATVATTLFPDSDPLGQQIRAGNYILNVTGVMQSSGQSIAGSTDNSIITPFTTLQLLGGQSLTKNGDHVVRTIGVMETDVKYATQVTNDITALLLDRHGITDATKSDFQITSVEALLASVNSITGQLTLLLGAIAAISLLVGGIGVMNIMLVSVLERTREIGIRKALGAKESDIWSQFLVEAIFLTFSGGIIGVIFGVGGALIINRTGLFTTVITSSSIILAVSVSVGIGLFFGFYPAWNASRLEPIKALRTE